MSITYAASYGSDLNVCVLCGQSIIRNTGPVLTSYVKVAETGLKFSINFWSYPIFSLQRIISFAGDQTTEIAMCKNACDTLEFSYDKGDAHFISTAEQLK